MTIFLQSLDYQLWHIIVNGPRMPTITIDGVVSPKPENEYNDNDFRMLQLNSKAKHVLFCAVGPNEFNRISSSKLQRKIVKVMKMEMLRLLPPNSNRSSRIKKVKRISKRTTFKMKNQANGKNQHAMNARSPATSKTNVQTLKRKSNSRKRMDTSRRRKQW
ncbi:hypothetical protein CFOL_v3_10562 [Cephalotus follicularis]|uniref:UBN2 domain-containing protein n=1 Tax=Cephalotus follicularis TaxID=3775 RepID=A0A1Q3BH07_CEPFO|nr:hypothetical protein CFOL_v3_10562 [Cephalotus follicularis]